MDTIARGSSGWSQEPGTPSPGLAETELLGSFSSAFLDTLLSSQILSGAGTQTSALKWNASPASVSSTCRTTILALVWHSVYMILFTFLLGYLIFFQFWLSLKWNSSLTISNSHPQSFPWFCACLCHDFFYMRFHM